MSGRPPTIRAGKNHRLDGEHRPSLLAIGACGCALPSLLIGRGRAVEGDYAVDGLASEMAGGIAGELQDDVRAGDCVSSGDVYFQGGIGKGRVTVAGNRQRPFGHLESAGYRRDCAADQRDVVEAVAQPPRAAFRRSAPSGRSGDF
jgi:hypothetical protein